MGNVGLGWRSLSCQVVRLYYPELRLHGVDRVQYVVQYIRIVHEEYGHHHSTAAFVRKSEPWNYGGSRHIIIATLVGFQEEK